MKIVQATAFGDPDVLKPADAPAPTPGPGQALIRVQYVPVLFLDTQIRAGHARAWFRTTPPYVPGAGVAGVVEAVGDGADPGWLGRRVVADTPDGGGYAECVAVDVETLIEVPDNIGLSEAAALLHDGRTALKLIDVTRPEPGDRVLVLGAAGGLGALLVQLARDAGAQVIGAVSGQERKLTLVRELGACAVDYTRPGWADAVREMTQPCGVDVILDGIGGRVGIEAFELIAKRGRFSAHGTPGGGFAPIDPAQAANRGVTLTGIEQVQLAPAQVRQLVSRALAHASRGHVYPVVGQTFSLEAAADAHRAIESRHAFGKTLLEA